MLFVLFRLVLIIFGIELLLLFRLWLLGMLLSLALLDDCIVKDILILFMLVLISDVELVLVVFINSWMVCFVKVEIFVM